MNVKLFAGLFALVFTLVCPPLLCASAALDAETLQRSLKTVRAPELPARAALIVSQAEPADQERTAEAVVRAALRVRPASAPAVVGAISRSTPGAASIAATTAISLQPKMLGPIVKAAAAAAPTQADEIVYAVSKRFPKQYRLAAVAASEGAPQASPDILAAVGSAFPNLKPHIQNAVAASPQTPVSAILASPGVQAAAEPVVAQLSGKPQPPPVKGEPFTPGGGTPGELKRAQTVIVAPGSGRNYSTPSAP